jgi:hypothetical protein
MSDIFLTLRGKLDWAKLTGAARPYKGNPKFDKGPSWSLDLTPDAKTLALLDEHDLLGKLKDPKKRKNDNRTEKFLSLKLLENRKDGTKNPPPRVSDVKGNPWGSDLIGNGSIADVKVKVVAYDGVEPGVYLQAVRILSLVPYEVNDFEPLSEDDEFFGDQSAFAADPVGPEQADFESDLDDDVPF